MRWARFDQNGTPTYGVVEGDEIIPVRGSPFDMWERTSSRLQLSEVRLLTPVEPPTFYAAGLNYAEHVREAAEKLGL
jgi:2-keto-4-pentenoate hydratase/2-oxohepta-3-ene-1,7-dioic acid hydratase in catechol pathway